MNFCPDCGGGVSLQTVKGDHRQRYVCNACSTTHYQRLSVIVACYVCVGEKVLWIRRGIAPAQGRWAIPGGFMEHDETPEEAVSRELLEETGIAVPADKMILVSISSLSHMGQTHLVYRCHLEQQPVTIATEEAPHSEWFDDEDMPWRDMAFASIEPQIRQMYRWLRNGNYGIRVGVIDQTGSHYKNYPLAN